MIKCLLFDLDGTLFDQYDANRQAYSAAFAELGIPFDATLYPTAYGLRFEEFIAVMAPGVDSKLHPKMKQLKVKYYPQNFHLVRPNYGLLTLLRTLKGQYDTALVTTARKKNVLNLLKHFGVETKLFTVIVAGEDVKHGKPDPECYELAIKKLNTKPEECLVFEDTDIGIEAAKRAGVQVVKVQI